MPAECDLCSLGYRLSSLVAANSHEGLPMNGWCITVRTKSNKRAWNRHQFQNPTIIDGGTHPLAHCFLCATHNFWRREWHWWCNTDLRNPDVVCKAFHNAVAGLACDDWRSLSIDLGTTMTNGKHAFQCRFGSEWYHIVCHTVPTILDSISDNPIFCGTAACGKCRPGTTY